MIIQMRCSATKDIIETHQRFSYQSKEIKGYYERAIIQSISDGFMIVDKNGIISFLNDKVLEILGVDRGLGKI